MWMVETIKNILGRGRNERRDDLNLLIDMALEERRAQSERVKDTIEKERASTYAARQAALDVMRVLQQARTHGKS